MASRKKAPSTKTPTLRRFSRPPETITAASPAPQSQGIDTSLYVGPVYDGTNRRRSVIKEQLGDITQRLHKTLRHYDVMEEFDNQPQISLLENMSKNIDNMDRNVMKQQLEAFMGQYQHMSLDMEETRRQKDELLLQVADWFQTDHVDLDDITAAIDEDEAEDIKQNYTETMANIEKLKSIREDIIRKDFRGKNTKVLEMEKKKLETEVMEKIKELKAVHNKKTEVNDVHWKHAAGEVVQLLNRVRTETADERETLTSKIEDLVKLVDRQQIQIRSLQGEVKKEKKVASHLTDDVTELTAELAQLRAKIAKYESELEQAKKMIEKQFADLQEKDTSGLGPVGSQDDQSSSTTVGKTLSEVLVQFMAPSQSNIKDSSSNPALLRSSIREHKENIDLLTKELTKAKEKINELQEMNDNKLDLLDEQEETIRAHGKRIKALQREATQANAKIKELETKEYMCPKCNNKTPEPVEVQVAAAGDAAMAEENERLKEVVQQLTLTLSDTEKRLSDAFKEISDLRVAAIKDLPAPPPPPRQPTPRETPPPVEKEATPPPPEVEEKEPEPKEMQEPEPDIEEPPPVPEPTPVIPEKVTTKPKEMTSENVGAHTKPRARERPPPKKRVVSKHQNIKQPKAKTLPPIRKPKHLPPPPPPEPEVNRSERDQILYKIGELQSLMNTIIADVMDFSAGVGNMIYKEKAEDNAPPSMRTFEFGNDTSAPKRTKMVPLDPKEAALKDKKSQVFFQGQRVVAMIRDMYDILAKSLDIVHDEFEMIYKSYKENQEKRLIERAILRGEMPEMTIFGKGQEVGQNMQNLLSYYMHVYGKQTGKKVKKGYTFIPSQGPTEHRSLTSVCSSQPSSAATVSHLSYL